MLRRLLNFATALSLVLFTSAVAMWARSLTVTEAWEFTPRLHANAYAGKGHYTHRLVESADGRLVYVDYDAVNAVSRFSVSRTTGSWQTIETVSPLPTPGYRQSAAPLTPELRGRGFAIPIAYLSNFGSASGRVPGIAEWYIVPFTYRRRFIAVSWLLIAGLAAILPSVRVVIRWRRWRRGRLPAFLVLVKPTPSTARVAPVS